MNAEPINRRLFVSPLTFLAPIALVLAGTAYILLQLGGEEKNLTIAVKQGAEGIALKEIAQNFSRDKHVSIEVIQLPYDDLYEAEERQVKERAPKGSEFDVFMVDDPWLYSLMDTSQGRGYRLKNVNGILNEQEPDFFDKTLVAAKYCPSNRECRDYFGIPFVANSQLFAYHPSSSRNGGKPSTWIE